MGAASPNYKFHLPYAIKGASSPSVMASNSSKIPIYKKSSLPIASKDYSNVVKDVKRRQSIIRAKLDNTQNLKTQLGKLAADIEATKDKVGGRSDKKEHEIPVFSNIQPFVAPANTQERSIIRTQGGTKRKGMLVGFYDNYAPYKMLLHSHCHSR